MQVISDTYNYADWSAAVEPLGEHTPNTPERIVRCSACYLLRFKKAAAYAKQNGFTHISTTLSVSPYQYTDAIAKKLRQAANAYNVNYVFEDFTPQYLAATKRSKDLGMYRQHYCGCEFSQKESQTQEKLNKEKKQANIAQQNEIHKAAQKRHEMYAKKNALKKQYKKIAKSQQKH